MRADKPLLVAAAVLGCAVAPGAWSQSAADCANLVSLKLPDTADLTAAVVEGSKFTPPAQGNPAPAARNVQGTLFASLPAFCRVTGVIKPAVRFEVWLPMKDWNGKFQGTGNGGYNGAIVYTALAGGFATALCDGQYRHGPHRHDSGSGQLGAASSGAGR